jgi:branched-chain amino acid transport system ATP-binding protein
VSPLLDAVGITRRFGGLAAVDGVSVDVEPGTVLGLIGPNGAGKTTLVNLLSGHDRPTAGRVTVGGRDLTGARPWDFARTGVARTFQVAKPFRGLTVAENVATGAMYGADPERSVSAALARTEAVLATVGLAGQAHQRAAELSVRDQGVAVVVVEHVVRAVFAVSDSVLVRHQGRPLARGTPGEVAADERVIAAYLGRRYAQRKGR